jgi:uncharacterized protein (TIGR00251 family)
MIIKIKVHPNSRTDEIVGGDPLVVRVTDSPEKNKANRKVIKLLSEHFNAKVNLLRGGKSREKTVEIIK